MQERVLKVYYWDRDKRSVYKYQYATGRRVPRIILQGDWLRAVGFDVSDHIIVKAKRGKLVIMKKKNL